MAPSRLDPSSYFGLLRSTVASNSSKTTPEDIDTLSSFYQRQLWHEFSLSLTRLFAEDTVVRSAAYDVHETLLVPIRSNLDGSVYVRCVFHACVAALATDDSTVPLIDSLIDSSIASLLTSGHTQCAHAMHCIKALVMMTHGPSLEAKSLIDAATDAVDGIPVHELLPVLQACLHRAKLRQAELLSQYSAFYVNAFAAARYGLAAGIPLLGEELAAVSYKTAIAALLAPDVYNFGDFLTNADFVKALTGGPNDWVLEALRMCSNGSVDRFESFVSEHRTLISNIPDLDAALASGRLALKVRLMALLHLVFVTPSDQRNVSFSTVSRECGVPLLEVERLLITAMAQRLIEGSIDEVDSVVHITWSLPRVMDLGEIEALAQSIGKWRVTVRTTAVEVGRLAAQINK